MDNNWTVIIAILSLVVSVFGPIIRDVITKQIERRKEAQELKNRQAEEEKINAESGETEANAAKINVDTAKTLLEQQRILFDQEKEFSNKRMLAIEDTLKTMENKQSETDKEIRRMKDENSKLHAENYQLNKTIDNLENIILVLRKLVKKLMGGIDKLVEYFKQRNEPIPWKPELTDKEKILLNDDFSTKDIQI